MYTAPSASHSGLAGHSITYAIRSRGRLCLLCRVRTAQLNLLLAGAATSSFMLAAQS
jgi:hypothetical protein